MNSILNAEQIRRATEAIHDLVAPSPLIRSSSLSKLIHGNVYLKLESLNICGSFKPRGAFWKLSQLVKSKTVHGVITMSAGNHAQAVAYMAREFGVKAIIYMPENASPLKVERTMKLGAEIKFNGQTLNDSEAIVNQRVSAEGLDLIHPYDDWDIITGQGSIAVEICEALDKVDSVIVPMGGGGLIGGIATYFKAVFPHVNMIGVQNTYSPTIAQILAPEVIPNITSPSKSLADGISVKGRGAITLPIVQENVQEFVVLDEFLIAQAIKWCLQNEHLVAEGAGAAGVGAILHNPKHYSGQNVVVIISGGNIDNDVLKTLL